MTAIGLPPAPGQLVHVRQRRYLVEETVPPPNDGDAHLVRLACVDDDAQGQPLEVLWEYEVDPQILTESWEDLGAKGFDPPGHFAAYMHTLRWNSVTATDPKLFQSPFRAGIRLDAYQLEPLRKALQLPRVNLFIADDVGLGKTIEAGLIARELLLRRKIREIVIIAPPSMLLQWRDEMDTRFGLGFEILDREYVARVRRDRGYGINPWTTHPRFLVSNRLIIDETYMAGMRDHLGDFAPGTLLILDEAHHAAPASGSRYAIDSKITRAVRDIAHRFEHRLFLSATPHNGHSNSFSALLEILDPQRFVRGVPVTPKLRDEVLVRRLKEDLREIAGGFPRRIIVQEDIDGLPDDAPELRLAELLDRYRSMREQRLESASKRARAAAGLLIVGLQQRLLSSIEAFARTLRVHRRTAQRQWDESQVEDAVNIAPQLDLTAPDADDDRATLQEDDLAADIDAQIETATEASAGGPAEAIFAQEKELLEEMSEIAEQGRGHADAKVRKLIDWIRTNQLDGTKWNDRRVIVFTEYDDTRRFLHEQLTEAIEGTDRTDERIAIFHGPTPLDVREEIKRAFNAPPDRHPVRILIATDAAREGLNLQAHCWDLFHFDIPWNPSRMEQRNGRIDRKLQSHDEVYCHYFVYHQRPEDRVLQVLVAKTERIRKELGSLAPVVERRLEEQLVGGIRRADIDRLEAEISADEDDQEAKKAIAAELEESRERQDDLRKQIDSLRSRLETSRDWVGLNDEHFRQALTVSLELLGAEPLKPTTDEDGTPRFAFPALDERSDPTWANTMDALRAPRERKEDLFQWRRDSPIRDVVFRDPGIVTEDVVQLHLEQGVVKRLLGRFSAQGFVHHELSRACLTQSEDSIPRVVLLGRLALYGHRGARLHEELVAVSARWTDPRDRKGKLKPYARDAEAKTLQLLEESLISSGRALPQKVAGQLLGSVAQDVAELRPHLAERCATLIAEAKQMLASRGDQEAEAMRDILDAQRKRLQRHAKEYQNIRLELEEEDRQIEANRRHWERRLESLRDELTTEPERVQHAYEVVAERVEPVGLVYLWPETN